MLRRMRSEENEHSFQPSGSDPDLCPADLLAGSSYGRKCSLHPSIPNPDPAENLGTRVPLFTAHLPATMSVVAIGLGISVVLGLGLAVLWMPRHGQKSSVSADPAPRTIPTTALAPLFVLWFGYSIWGKVLVTVLITFFPITITVFDGFQSVKTEMEELLFTFGASPAADFLEIKGPGRFAVFLFCHKDGGSAVHHCAASENGWVPRAVLAISAAV